MGLWCLQVFELSEPNPYAVQVMSGWTCPNSFDEHVHIKHKEKREDVWQEIDLFSFHFSSKTEQKKKSQKTTTPKPDL